MARARNIKPGFYKNEDLAECSIWARYIFPGLWMLADREGRLEDRPKRIKGELLPFDAHDVEPLLRELAVRGFIVRYQIQGAPFIQISKFRTHQAPHYSEKPSLIKPPQLPESDGSISPSDSGNPPGIKAVSQPPDSLIPDSRIPSKALSAFADGAFSEFWQAYPRKTAKEKAKTSWSRIRPDNELATEIIGAIERHKASEQWKRGVIPHAATWLNQRRWEDETSTEAVNGARRPWFLQSSTAIEAKGLELGVQAEKNEAFPYYRSRVLKAAGVSEDQVDQAKKEWGIR